MASSSTTDIAAGREAYRSYFDAGVSALMSRIWEGSLHLGLFASEDEPLAQAQRRLKTRIATAAQLRPGHSVIEVACGVGTTAIHLAKEYGVRVHATNISEDQLAEARERADRAGLDSLISFAIKDYHELGGPSGAYDCWLCQEALLYASDRAQVFTEARRVVRPGGKILFTDLTLSRALPSNERESLMRDVRAPYLWSIEEYDSFVDGLPLKLVQREDWSTNAVLTFAAVARNLKSLREEFVMRIGERSFREAELRIDRQFEAARAGYLGWCFYCLEQ